MRDQGFGFRVQGVGWFRTFYRAFGGAALRVHVFDARVDAAISHVTVIPAPPAPALAGSVAQATPVLVAGTWGLRVRVQVGGLGVQGLGSGVKGFGSRV